MGKTWSILFLVFAMLIAMLVPFLAPDSLVGLAICYVLGFLFGGLLLGSKAVLWSLPFYIIGVVLNIMAGHSIEERYFVSLDPTTSRIVAPVLGGFLLAVTGVVVYLLLNGQEKLFREVQIANMESEKAKAIAEQASRAKSSFLATMSHEIRTPMNAPFGDSRRAGGGWRDREQEIHLRSVGRHGQPCQPHGIPGHSLRNPGHAGSP